MKENTRLIVNRILSILSGVVAGVIIISIFELIANNLFPFPAGFDPQDPKAFSEHLSNLPATAFVIVLLGHGIGALIGGFVTSKMANVQKKSAALFTGLILMLAALLNLISIPHPLWYSIINIAIYSPMAYAGNYFQEKISKK